jgi:hypothetical protein
MKTTLLALLAVGGLAASAAAQNAIYTGDTNMGAMNGRPASFTVLSGATSLFNFHSQPFYVSAGGEYTAEANTNSPLGNYDGYFLIYANSFDPTQPLVNLIAGDDDYSGVFSVLSGSSGSSIRASRIILGDSSNFGGAATGLNLAAGIQYFAVHTTFGAGVAGGTFEAGIGNGPGNVTLGIVPAPSSLALLGLGGLLAARRRR